CLFSCAGVHPALHSFPTRRSSDLAGAAGRLPRAAVDSTLRRRRRRRRLAEERAARSRGALAGEGMVLVRDGAGVASVLPDARLEDRKSTRLNSSHVSISYAVFCLK